jgi:hypothetical protein
MKRSKKLKSDHINKIVESGVITIYENGDMTEFRKKISHIKIKEDK